MSKWVLVACIALLMVRCTAVSKPAARAPTPIPHCHIHEALPDPICTPGAVYPVTREQVCKSGYAGSVRNVPESEKNTVYKEYGILRHVPGAYEVDHLISLELGGSNEIKNLWPESYTGLNNAHDKDKVENSLHSQVCSKIITLEEAQREIAMDWLAVYGRAASQS